MFRNVFPVQLLCQKATSTNIKGFENYMKHKNFYTVTWEIFSKTFNHQIIFNNQGAEIETKCQQGLTFQGK